MATERLTYDQLAERLGITREAARHRQTPAPATLAYQPGRRSVFIPGNAIIPTAGARVGLSSLMNADDARHRIQISLLRLPLTNHRPDDAAPLVRTRLDTLVAALFPRLASLG